MATHVYYDTSSYDKAISSYFILTLTRLSKKLLFKNESVYVILEPQPASSFRITFTSKVPNVTKPISSTQENSVV